MPLDAVTDVMLSLIDADRQEAVRIALIRAGAPDGSIKGVLMSATKKLGSKILGNVADDLVDDASAYLSPFFKGALGNLTEQWSDIFQNADE